MISGTLVPLTWPAVRSFLKASSLKLQAPSFKRHEKDTIKMYKQLRKKEIMKNTIEKINKQHSVLVDVIQWLDEKHFSNTEIREKVDNILNHSRKLHEDSNIELEVYQVKKRNA